MALIDKASLLMVPSTYEAGKLYNVLPSGNRAPDSTDQNSGYDQTRADFDFDRGSNAAATRVNASGLIEKGRENLLVQSNQFDTTWVNISSTETSGQEGYDGTNNAWLLTKNATNGRIQQSITGTGVYTFSVYAKAGVNNWCTLIADFVSGTDVIVWFDLQNGIVGTESGSPIESKISSIDNGWYRISISFTCPASLQTLRIYVADGDNDNSGTTGSIYIQSAQLESGLVASSYLDSTSVTGKAGVLVDLPRINYDANGQNASLLLEPSRQNLITQSEYINTTDWNHQGVTSSVNTSETTSPEGVYNAVKFTATNTDPYIFRSISVSTGDNTFSFYVKGTGSSVGKTARILFWYIGTATGTQTSHNFTLTDEWQRVDATTSPTGAGTLTFRIDIPADSAVVGDVCYLYGLQLELGSYVSSYIPTMGTSETRAADSCSVTGVSDVIGQTEGTLFFECTNKALVNQARYFLLSDGTFNNRIDIYQFSEDKLGIYVATSGAAQVSATNVTLPSSGSFKFALAYANNDYIWYLNGTQIGTDTTGSVPTLTNALFALNAAGGTLGGSGNSPFKQAILFNERLSNAELATLTTL
jgi:hypothetical protein